MAECSKILEFKIKKEIFDKAAFRLTCSDCKAVPKDVPIFQTSQGDVLCYICKPKSKLTGIFQSFVLEDLLMSLPISCKYQKNECPIVLQNREHLSYHEEDCEFRDILCSYPVCKEIIPANEFQKHFLEKHKMDLEKTSILGITEMAENGVVLVKNPMKTEYFDGRSFSGTGCYFYNDSKSFLIHSRISNGNDFLWLQLVGSQFEARNYEYSLKFEGPLDVGKFSYEGTVRSLDDNKNNIRETGLGLSIPHGALKKLAQDDYDIELKIKDLKAELNKGEEDD